DDSTTATPMNDASKEAPIDGSKKAHKVLKSYLKKSDVTINPNANFVKTTALDRPTPLSFASVLQDITVTKTVKITKLHNSEVVEGEKVSIPLEAMEEFATKEGMEKVIENGPWLIRLVPLILNVWTPNSLLAAQLCWTPTLVLCVLSRGGRNTYARALIEMSSEKDLLDSIVVAIPFSNGKGHSLVTVEVEYEWKPPDGEPSKPQMIVDNLKNKQTQTTKYASPTKTNNVTVKNSFSALPDGDESVWGDEAAWMNFKQVSEIVNESDNEEMEELVLEAPLGETASGQLNAANNEDVGESTPNDKGTGVILGWNSNMVDVTIISQDDQTMHVCLWIKAEKKELFSLNLEDKSVGSSNIDISMREFKECVDEVEVSEVQRSGLNFTWNQKPRGEDGILKKIDRIMANQDFTDVFIGAHAIFQPYRISDHSPAVLKIPMCYKVIPMPFKFANILVHNERFKDLIKEGWSMHFSGFSMFCVVQKLKSLKKPIHKLLYGYGNLYENVKRLRVEVDKVQADLDADPFNPNLREEEAAYVQAFNDALIMEERFLKQKEKIKWLRVDDSNLVYFYKMVKSHVSRSRIDGMSNSDGVSFGRPEPTVALDMVRNVTRKEVKDAIISMGNDKSPRADGFIAAFFKVAWDIMVEDVTKAIQEFFSNGNLLKELNHTIIALIHKVTSPSRINDYRPISCCNVLFKCITKIIPNHIKVNLKALISPNQSAFVPGRRISENILLTQELMHNYHLDCGPPRCAFKVDIQKAYDTVDWVFLKDVLIGFGFYDRMIGWIMECVSSTSFSLSINEVLHGYFKGKRGLRQGAYFNSPTKDAHSAMIIMEALNEFKLASGLVLSLPKSTAYFCNVLNHTKLAILNILPFKEGCLPVKYLGVPLISSRLIYRDCKELIEKVQHRIQDWKNKSLSAAGRLQLVQSVINFMHVYWVSVFILPSCILLDIEQLMRGFLWCQGNMRRGKAKVAWEVVCVPKKEGGLGLRKIELFNKALMISHIWNLLSRKDSL
ncbi:hypothetical protein Tco_0282697, partial [Tanacetum coccineum]